MIWTFFYGCFVSEPVGPKELRVVVRPDWVGPVEGAEWLALIYGPTHPINYDAMGGNIAGWGPNPEKAMTAGERVLGKVQT
jgi:hypothetical protein